VKEQAMSAVIVGVDGSPGSVAALKYAIEEARLRDAALTAVTAWSVPALAYEADWTGAELDPQTFEAAANSTLTNALSGVDTTGVEVNRIVREGQAADVLVLEAGENDLLVVGSRGLGGFRGLMLGSVSHQCTTHARCPVTVVPHPRTELS
jgi:nucleotide-binding universal stress UspA family protein